MFPASWDFDWVVLLFQGAVHVMAFNVVLSCGCTPVWGQERQGLYNNDECVMEVEIYHLYMSETFSLQICPSHSCVAHSFCVPLRAGSALYFESAVQAAAPVCLSIPSADLKGQSPSIRTCKRLASKLASQSKRCQWCENTVWVPARSAWLLPWMLTLCLLFFNICPWVIWVLLAAMELDLGLIWPMHLLLTILTIWQPTAPGPGIQPPGTGELTLTCQCFPLSLFPL